MFDLTNLTLTLLLVLGSASTLVTAVMTTNPPPEAASRPGLQPPAVRPRFSYRPELDGIRALAVAGVIIAHTSGERFGNGYMGVELFFVLSGYLITALLLGEHQRNNSINFRHFYARRALRLLPALYACIAVWAVLGVLARPEARSEHYLGVLAGATYVSNWVRALTSHNLGPTGYLWSLAVEEQFYLFWPPFVAFMLRRKFRNPALIVGVLVVLASAWRMVLSARGASAERLDNGLDTRVDALLMGACLAYVLARRPTHSRDRVKQFGWTTWISAALLLGLVGSWLFPEASPPSLHNLRGFSFAAPLCFAMVAPIVAFGRSADGEAHPGVHGTLVRILSWGPLVRVGRLSYGLYLWHSVAIFLFASRRLGLTGAARVVPTIVTLVVLALLSEKFVEQPFMRRKTRFNSK